WRGAARMTAPDRSRHGLGPVRADGSPEEWAVAVKAETGHEPAELAWATPEGIAVPIVHDARDVAGLDFLRTYPGIKPFVRGPYPTMYVNQPWTIRQYAGFSTA